jgi:hypothetical protein
MRHHQDLHLYPIQAALMALRAAEPPSWELVATICGIHFQDHFPQLPGYLRVQNVTGIMALFSEEADRLTRELPGQMTDPHRPLTAVEAENCASRITLLREAAIAANAIVFPAQAAHRHDAVVIPIRRSA